MQYVEPHLASHAHLARRRGLRIPFDLRILRILLPAPGSQHKLSSTLLRLRVILPVTTLT